MPFSPLHMGPALTAKAVSPTAVSLIVYGTSQILIDLQPLAALTVMPQLRIHGLSHTFAVALILGVLAAAIGKYTGQFLLNVFQRKNRERVEISWVKAFGWGIGGALLHIAMDGLVYEDMQPFWPFMDYSRPNPMRYLGVSNQTMTTFCVYTGLAGLLVYGVAAIVKRISTKNRG
ncbi:MAG: metal-dependent hydrolase [Anaerolineaceae bacterium]